MRNHLDVTGALLGGFGALRMGMKKNKVSPYTWNGSK